MSMFGRTNGTQRSSGHSAAVLVSRKYNVALCLLICLIALAYACSPALADVDTVGKLEPASSPIKSPLHEVSPLVDSSHNGEYKCGSAWQYSDFHQEAFGLVMGNCKAGTIFEVVDYGGPNNKGVYSYGGYAEGSLSGCGWIESNTAPEKIGSVREPKHCGSGSEVSTPYSSFLEKYNGEATKESTEDGYFVVNKVPCKEYANFKPWLKSQTESELIRTVPAYTPNQPGSDVPALKWRYTTKYNSADGSGQYVMVRDVRISGGEGNWVFVPRSCLPTTLPESEGELIPPPPTVTTTAASEIATPDATLNATVNPNGVETKYYFEYGTSTGYGKSTSTGTAGSGKTGVQVHAKVENLAPGTTYYFRIVASSGTGESFGAPVSFPTQAIPTVVTSAAINVEEKQATLNGTVNPHGLATQYHFEYGTPPGYAYSTPVESAGNGETSVPESANITGLTRGTQYHFRIVATSSAGTEVGNEQSLTTTAPHPAAIVHSNNNQDVLFTGLNGGVGDLGHTTMWSLSELTGFGGGVTATGSPSVVVDHSGTEDAFVTGTNGQIYEERLVGGVWTATDLGGPVSAAGSPSAVVLKEGAVEVFFRATNGQIYVFWASSGAGPWTLVDLEGSAAGDPTASLYEANNTVNVYFVGTNGALWSMWATNGTAPFGRGEIGGHPSVGAVSAWQEANGGQNVWFRGTNGAIWEEYWNPSNAQWTLSEVGGAAAGEPSGLIKSSGAADLFYRSTESAICELEIYALKVTKTCLGGTATGDPVAVLEGNGYQDVYFAGSGAIFGWFQGSGGWALGDLGIEAGLV
jgi:hypothetical protein